MTWRGARYVGWRVLLCTAAVPFSLAASLGIWQLARIWAGQP
jgi:hypothetical protein